MAIKGLPGLPRSCTRWKAAQSQVLLQGAERATPRREQIPAQIQSHCGQGGGLRVQASLLDGSPAPERFPSLLQPPGSSSLAVPPTLCWNKKFPRAA